jgi:disulfide bond formation protein DsbB
MATGFCEDEALVILGLSLAQWALICFLLATGIALFSALRGPRLRN